jgi:hypothetical protein
MKNAIGLYFLLEISILVIIVIASIIWDRRYKAKHKLDAYIGFERTEEVTVDPNNNKRFRVYYNPDTGKRLYKEEPSDI